MGIILSVLNTIISGLRQSFFIPPPTLTEQNLPDQFDRVFIVTGSNTGVGYEAARILYAANGTVYVAARTESKARDAIRSIKASAPESKGTLHFLQLDLSDLSTIKDSVSEFMRGESRLDVLINNAGVMFPPAGSKSVQDHELQYGTNVLGPYLFTKLLSPALAETAKTAARGSVRVSWAGSLGIDVMTGAGGASFNEDGSLYDFKTGGQGAYGASKVANYFLAYEFGKRFGNRDGVLHTSFNPGNLKSELQRHAHAQTGGFTRLFDFLLYPAVFGAYTEIFAGLSPALTLEGDQGGYIIPWGRVGSVRPDIARECREGGKSQMMYEWCERETGKFA